MGKQLEFTTLDFFDEKDVLMAFTFSSVDYRSIIERKGIHSKTIKMPSTKVNDTFFGYSFDPANTGNFDPSIKVPIKILEIEFFGYLQLNTVELLNGKAQSYSVNIFGDLSNWASLIGEESIRTLKHHTSHVINEATVTDSWTHTGEKDHFVYPLISYGNFLQDIPTSVNTDPVFLRPAFFVLPLLRQIFKEIGYTFIDTGYNKTPFKNAILPFTSKEVEVDDDLLDARVEVNTVAGTDDGSQEQNPIPLGATVLASKTSSKPENGSSKGSIYNFDKTKSEQTKVELPWTLEVNDPNDNYIMRHSNIVPATGEATGRVNLYTVTVADYYEVNAKAGFSFFLHQMRDGSDGREDIEKGSPGGTWQLGVRKRFANGAATAHLPFGSIFDIPSDRGFIQPDPQYVKGSTLIHCERGDSLSIILIITLFAAGKSPTCLEHLTLETGAGQSASALAETRRKNPDFGRSFATFHPQSTTLIPGVTLDHAKVIQNIKKIDLVRDIIVQGNFRVITNNGTKTVEFIQEDDFFLNETEDWTDKFDESRPSSLALAQNTGPKELEWSHNNDSDDTNITFLEDRHDVEWGQKLIQLESEFRKGSTTVYKSIFSSTIDGLAFASLQVPVMTTTEAITIEGTTTTIIQKGLFETKFEDRILIYDGLRAGSWIMNNKQLSEYPYSYFIGPDFSLQWNDLSAFTSTGGGFFQPLTISQSLNISASHDIGLVDRYYVHVIERLNKSKVLTAFFFLTEIDIATLDFRKPKVVNGTQYYLNKVRDYILNGNTVTKVELISK